MSVVGFERELQEISKPVHRMTLIIALAGDCVDEMKVRVKKQRSTLNIPCPESI